MRKILLLMIGVVIALTSCQKNDLDVNGGGQQAVLKISAVVPAQGFDSRAVAPQIPAGYQLRYILEVYSAGVPVQHVAQFSPDFNVRLVTSTDYDFVMWADYVPATNSNPVTNHHYNADDLTAISTITATDYEINDPSRDAFYCKESMTVVGGFAVSFTLQRPFAQIRIKTDDLAAIILATQQPAQVGITYTAGVSTGFNAMTGTKTTPVTTLVFGPEDTEAAPYSAAGETTAAGWLAFDYIFADKGTTGLVDFTLSLYNSIGTLITTNDKFVNIPIKQNYRTNISGNLLTAGGSISVVIDAAFNNGDLEVEIQELQTLSNFQDALNALTPANNLPIAYRVNDVDVNTLSIGANAANVPSILLSLANGLGSGTLTINGGSYAGIIKIDVGNSPAGKLIINAPNATVSVVGSIGQLDATTSGSTLLIGKDVWVGTLNLLGGNAEIFGTVNTFGTVAAGCKVYWGATDAASLKAAHQHANPNDGIVLGADISGIDTEVFITRAGYSIDGRGFKLSGPVSQTGQTGQSSTNMIALIGGCNNVTIRNISVTNTLGHGINVFASTGVILDKVSLLNNAKAGLIINGSTVAASNITSSGNAWYFANLDQGTELPVIVPHLTMSGVNHITDAVAMYSEGNYLNFNGTVIPAGAKDASNWVSGGNWIPTVETYVITNLIGPGAYGGHFSYVWAQDNGTNALHSEDAWGIDNFLTQSYSLTADFVQTTVRPIPASIATDGKFREWQGIQYSPSFPADVSSWSAETSLNIDTNGPANTIQSFWVEVGANSLAQIDYIAVAYAPNAMPDAYGGPYPAGWSKYDSTTGLFVSVSGISTSKGAHALKISRSGKTTSVSVDGTPIHTYEATDAYTQTVPRLLMFNVKTYTNTVTTTWSYPQVN